MATYPDPSQNFIHALSDFWAVFFKDTTQIKTFYQGVELNLGQIYLELLETVLGTSLRHAPVYSKKYFHQFTVGEDELFYEEGRSSGQDRYAYLPAGAALQDTPFLMNKVLAPTRLLESNKDYDVVDGELRFFQNIFDVDGAQTPLEYFPTRVVVKSFAAEYTSPEGVDWRSIGVRVGDFFRFRLLGGGAPFNVRITGIDGTKLLLAEKRSEFALDLSTRRSRVTVLRTPFDSKKSGEVLPTHPSGVVRLSGYATDLKIEVGTKRLGFDSEPYFKGAWAPSTSYTAGDLVLTPGLALVRALVDHTSGASYDPGYWDGFANKYLYTHDADNLLNDGICAIIGNTSTRLLLSRPANFEASTSLRVQAYLIAYPEGAIGSPQPTVNLPHPLIDTGSLAITARRAHPVYIPGRFNADGSPYYEPTGGGVIEGVDYVVDYEEGLIKALSGWDPLFPALAAYTWNYQVSMRNYSAPLPWASGTTYVPGNTALVSGTVYSCITANSDIAFDPGKWRIFVAPFAFDQSHAIRQMALWGTDVIFDRETLYTNFGYLLSFKRPSSEQYRAFLRGVAQLFVIGPTLERFESALNVMADLPVVRDDAEILRSYSSGIDAQGTAGELIDTDEGRDGELLYGSSTFSSLTTTFFPSDVGAVIRVKVGATTTSYVVTAVISPTTVQVSPRPPSMSAVPWVYTHVALNRRFRTNSYAFSPEDVDAVLVLESAQQARNNGAFRIVSVENASTVILESTYGFIDQTGVAWKLSKSKAQTVTTSRTTYTFPLEVSMRDDVMSPSSFNTLTFQAFEPLTKAFLVSDYLQDPTWWHNTTIPKEMLTLQVESAGRRHVSPLFIEHGLSPLDSALIGDFGLAVGADDYGNPGIARSGAAVWYGGDTLVLTFAAGVPVATGRDRLRYLTLDSPVVRGQFQIESVDFTGTILRLRDFPPLQLDRITPPYTVQITLPPLIYRHTVGFVMMDRYLKYHAVRVQVDAHTPLESRFLSEALQLLREAKPGFTYVYFETPLDFLDQMISADANVILGVGVPKTERLLAADNTAIVGPPGLLKANDAFMFDEGTQLISATPGTYTLTPTLPAAGAAPRVVRFHVVKGWFDFSVTKAGGVRLAEGVDYRIDRQTGKVTVLSPGLPSAAQFNYVYVVLRTRLPGDPFATSTAFPADETPIAVAGADPTTWWAATQTVDDAGLIDRAVQLTIGP